VALGLAITYGLMGVINMAHGELMMIGAYATYVVQNLFKQYLPGVRLVHRWWPSRRPSWPPRWWARCWSAR
jgi:branched-subunit amino acid ABC-type transport system permease component